ncbi:MAG: prolyl aminopeptidase [Acetobacterales bacterium]
MTYRRSLYPPVEPWDTGRLPVSDLHELHYEQCGNREGKPVLFVHGGPGGGCEPDDRRFFDPTAWRIVLFDQRGAGRSTPHACIEENTTAHLVSDIETLRRRLGIDRWVLFGGSWGSSLSLAYAETHPDRVAAMVLRGIFLVQRSEFDWYYRSGTPLVFPQAAERFYGLIPEDERGDMIAAYHRRIGDADPEVRRLALAEWARWEAETSSLLPDPDRVARYGRAEFAEAFAGIELHYFANLGFFDYEGQLLAEADRIARIPGAIVHGRYDMVCPLRNAVELSRRWTEAELQIIDDAGHDAFEPGTVDALVRATDRLRG